jgi:hypothetical protein
LSPSRVRSGSTSWSCWTLRPHCAGHWRGCGPSCWRTNTERGRCLLGREGQSRRTRTTRPSSTSTSWTLPGRRPPFESCLDRTRNFAPAVLTQVPAVRGSKDGGEALQCLTERAPVLGRTTFRNDYSRPPGYSATGFEEGATARHEICELYARVTEHLRMTSSHDGVTKSALDKGTKSSRRSAKAGA